MKDFMKRQHEPPGILAKLNKHHYYFHYCAYSAQTYEVLAPVCNPARTVLKVALVLEGNGRVCPRCMRLVDHACRIITERA